MIIDVNDYIAHYGTPRRSGRYPWGSGDDEEGQHNRNFLNYVAGLKNQGMTEAEIANGLGFKSTTQLRAAKSIAKNAQKQADIRMAQRLRDKGWDVRVPDQSERVPIGRREQPAPEPEAQPGPAHASAADAT